MRRVSKRDTRPLLRSGNPEATMRNLMDTRYPIYAEADLTVESRDEPHEMIVSEIVALLNRAGNMWWSSKLPSMIFMAQKPIFLGPS